MKLINIYTVSSDRTPKINIFRISAAAGNLLFVANHLFIQFFQTSNISGPLDACVTLTAVTAPISSPSQSMDGSGLLIKLGSIPQMELLSKTGPSPEGK